MTFRAHGPPGLSRPQRFARRTRCSAMRFDKKFLQRAFLAFTTGLFLACAARVSAANAQPVANAAASITR